MSSLLRNVLFGYRQIAGFGGARVASRMMVGACAIVLLGAETAPHPKALDELPPKTDGQPVGAPLVGVPPVAELPFGHVPLADFKFATEHDILGQLGWSEREAYEQSMDVVVAWTRGKRFAAIDRFCQEKFANDLPNAAFPLNALSLRCVPWWLESRTFAQAAERRKSAPRDERPSAPRPVVSKLESPEDWQGLAGASYRDFLRVFKPKKKEQVFAQIEHALDASVTCDLVTPMAALLGRAEEFLPDPEVWSRLVTLYNKYATCERPDDRHREMVHLRTGLAAVYFGDMVLARRSLALALEAPAQEDRQRALFWLGLLDQTQPEQQTLASHFVNRYWLQLFRESPISIHAVAAKHLQGLDPYVTLIGDVTQPVATRDGKPWSDYNLMALISELLIARNDAVSLGAWSHRLARDWRETDVDRVLYLALIHNHANNYLQSIQQLTVYLKATVGQKIRVEFLKLLFPTPFAESILDASGGLDPLVVFGLIRQESAFNPHARSIADARGLMQLLPGTARTMADVAPSDLYDPRKNVSLGSQYLRKLLVRNNNHLESVLAAYNAGQRHIERWSQRFPGASDLLFADLIPFRETRSYVSLIQRNSYWYGRLMRDRRDHYKPELVARIEESNIRSRMVDGLLKMGWGYSADPLSVKSLLMPVHLAAAAPQQKP
jgi:soluble lytic murein transglycosylase